MQQPREFKAMTLREQIPLLERPTLNEYEVAALYACGSTKQMRKMVADGELPKPSKYNLYLHSEIKEKLGLKQPAKFKIDTEKDLSIFNAWLSNGKNSD